MAENGPFETPFLIPKSPPKSLCGSLFGVLSQETRHIHFCLRAQNGVFSNWVGAKKFYVEKVYVLFQPPRTSGEDPPALPEFR